MEDEVVSMPQKRTRLKILIVILILCIIAAFIKFVLLRKENTVFSDFSIISEVEIENDIQKEYLGFAEGHLEYSIDGISYFCDGKEMWNKAYEYETPVVDVCDGYVAVGGIGKSEAIVISEAGEEWNINTSYPIINIQVSGQGMIAATMESDEANYVEIKDKDNQQIAMGKTTLSGDGYPVDVSLSNDGSKMVASYLAVSGGSTQSKVVFYNYAAVGQNYTDRIVGGFNQYTSTFVPNVEFINNNSAVAFGDNMFTIYSVKQKPSIKKEETFDKKVLSVFYNSKYAGMVQESDDSSNPYKILLYSASGSKVLSYDMNFQYDEICMAGSSILMYNANQCKIITSSGEVRYEGTLSRNIKKMIPVNGSKYVVVSDDVVETITFK